MGGCTGAGVSRVYVSVLVYLECMYWVDVLVLVYLGCMYWGAGVSKVFVLVLIYDCYIVACVGMCTH